MELLEFKRPFEVNDFTGGITDDIFLQNPRRAVDMDNFFIKCDQTLDSRDGSVVDDLVHPQIPAGVQRIGAMINYYNNDKMFIQSAKKIYYRNPSAYTTLQGPTGNDVFSLGDVNSSLSQAQWNGHLYVTTDDFPRPMKIYKDNGGTYQVRSSGLPALASSPTVTIGLAAANNYIYSFHMEYTYTNNNRTFQDFGPVTQVLVSSSSDPGTHSNAISVIPVLANGATDNWDTTVIRVFIYRTVAGGQNSYLIGNVTNGTTTFTDNFADSAILNNTELYIDDGTLDDDPPPLAKYVHVVNNTGYYGSLKVGSELLANTVRQSVPGDPDSVPQAFDIVVEDIVQGVSSAKSVPIILCKKYIYRVESAFDQFGAGAPNPVRISDTAGCISNASIVQAEDGIFWFGNDGIYATDGYVVQKISDGNNSNYKAFLANTTATKRIIGKFDEKERRVYWAFQRDLASAENDSMLILELRWGVSKDMPFTTWSGNSMRPSAIEFFNKQLYRGDSRGYVFLHDESYSTDPKVNTSVAASLWDLETIIWKYTSIPYNFGASAQRKYVTKMLLTASNRDNTSISITAINDDGKITRELKDIRWRRNFTWGSADFVWGSADCVWDAVGLIEQWRRMPAKGLRLSYLQVQITNAFTIIINSDTAGLATFDSVAKTITLGGAQVWPDSCVDYQISTEIDGYQKKYTVDTASPTTLHVLDPDSSLPNGTIKWELFGYKKGEPLNMLSYNLYWDFISETQLTYESGQDGANA